jgi:hypothetical protein
MNYSHFIEKLHAKGACEVALADIVEILNNYHEGLGMIQIIPIPFDPPNNEAFFRRIDLGQDSRHEDPFWNVAVYYCLGLDENPKQRRYVISKELMHAFDPPEAWADSKEKFIALLKDIQNEPLPDDRNLVFSAEIATRWKALIALCPKASRDEFAERSSKGDMEPYEIAAVFGLPQWVVPYILDDYFDKAYAVLTGKAT